MGLKEWLGLSASQPVGHSVRGDESKAEEPLSFAHSLSQQQRRRQRPQETNRRHTKWEVQQGQSRMPTYAPTRRSAPPQTRDVYITTSCRQPDRRFSSTSTDVLNDNHTMSTMVTAMQSPLPHLPDVDSEDSDVSIGTDDDFGPSPLPLITTTRPQTTTVAVSPAPGRNSVKDSFHFSWVNVLGQSTTLEMEQKGDMTQVVEDEAVKATRKNIHDPDVALGPQDDEMGVIMQGWLEKCGQQFKTWNWRFFVLRNDGVLSYYTDETLKKLKGSMDIGCSTKADVSVQSNSIDKNFVFMITTPQRNLIISAPSQCMMSKWIARLHAAGAVPTEPWDPLCKTVKFYVRNTECNHEWKRYDDPTSHIHMEGCLLKRGHVNKSWKNRFFRIERGELRYYTENQSELKGSVSLKDTIVSLGMTQCPDGRKYYFVLTSKDGKFEIHLNAHNENSMHLWIEALQEAQTALGRMAGTQDTVSGLSLVVKRAEEIPLGKIGVLFKRPEDIDIEMQKRTEALVVAFSSKNRGIAVGSQLIWNFMLPPYKRGVLIKKSRSGFENWKKRVIVVTNGEIHYFKRVSSYSVGKKAPAELKHRKSFSLYGCYLNLIQISGRDMCIVVARSPSDKLVLQTRTEEERMEWASVIYCSIRMVSQGITSGHIETLQLEHSRLPSKLMPSDLNGSFKDQAQLEF
ncbi:unnamed protein product [Peronospora destructor]|uniref:PH domain-containing protein n=1 Tax=Peronospora destructor TaxID=86335 RepID=A0AAV0UI37_9STRA|nr:unnamed protein product [Peronospora destructor]